MLGGKGLIYPDTWLEGIKRISNLGKNRSNKNSDNFSKIIYREVSSYSTR